MNDDTLHDILMGIVEGLEEKGIDIEATPALYRWRYPDCPNIEFHLLVKGLTEEEEDTSDVKMTNTTVH